MSTVANVKESGTKAPATDDGLSSQYLTFMLGGEEYGINILSVQEIKGWAPSTPIPNLPEHILGVMNLRGTLVPIIDVRIRFEFEKVEYGPMTVVIVVKIKGAERERTVGIVVDAVSEVYNVNQDDIETAPDMGNAINTEFIRGLASVGDKMVILLNIDELLDTEISDAMLGTLQ